MPAAPVIPSLESDSGTSKFVPFVSPSPEPPARKVNQDILNKVVFKYLSSSKYRGQEDMVETFFKELKKKGGYSDDQIEAAKVANKDLRSLMVPLKIKAEEGVSEPVVKGLDKDVLKKIDPLGSQWGILQPLADWSTDFAEKTVDNISQGLETTKSGVEEVFHALAGQTGSVEDVGTEIVHGGLKSLSGGTQVAFNTIPVAVAFNASTDAIKTVAHKNLSKENAETVEAVVDAPFTLGTKVASLVGYTPEEDSNGAYLLEILNFVAAGTALKAAKSGVEGIQERIKSIDDLVAISEKAAKKELTPEQEIEFNKYAENIKSVTIEDVKEAAQASGTPQGQVVAEKIAETQDKVVKEEQTQEAIEDARVAHISDMKAMEDPGSKEFYDKAMQALDNPAIVDRIKNSLNEAVEAGELSPEEAQVRIEHFEKIVGIDKTIPSKISDPADRMAASKLIEKKNDIKESVRGKDPILAAEEIERAKIKVEKIDEKLNQLKTEADAKAKQAKEAGKETGEEADVLEPEKGVHAIWKTALSEMKDESLKSGIERKGIEYIVKKEALTESAAQEVLDASVKADKVGDLEKVILDEKNEMDKTTRGVLSAMVGKHYFDLAEKTVEPALKDKYYDEFYKYTQRAAAVATEGGQIGNAVGKVIKKMYVNNPETVVRDMENRMRKSNEKMFDQEKAVETYETIKKILESPEGQKAITEEITKKSERLFGKETQKKISDFFDSAKIKNDGTLYSSVVPIPPKVINAAIEGMKQAALLGAKGLEIIEEGVRYIKENHKGEWNEKAFREDWETKLKASGVKFGKKRSVSKKEELSILDAIEKKAGRLNEKNKNKFLKDVIVEVEKEGGLSEQKFKDMYAEALGLPVMTEALSTKIKELSRTIRAGEQAKSKLSDAYDKVIKEKSENQTASKESLSELDVAKKEMQKAAYEANKAESELSSVVREKKDFADTFISLMQLNVLTPISLFRNVVGVVPDFMVIRPVTNFVSGGVDFLRASAANIEGMSKLMEAQKEVKPLARTVGAWRGTPDAFRNLYTTMITGEVPGRFGQRNMFNKLEPIKAGERILNALSGKDKMKASEWASSILESTVGWPAAAIGRGLTGPDVFIRTLAEQASLYEAGVAKGLRGEALEKFVKLPEAEAMESAKKYADEITYQQDNWVSSKISMLGKSFKTTETDSRVSGAVKPLARILGSTQALFVKTPTNVLWQSTKLAFPEIPLAQGFIEWGKGNKVEAERQFGYAATGMAIRLAMADMADKGIISPSTSYDDKKRMLEDNEGEHGGQLNFSRMMRYLSFQDNGDNKNDTWVDYKWLGPLGLVMGTQSSLAEEAKKSGSDMGYIENTLKGGLYSLKYASELPYVQSMGALADAMKDPERFGSQWISGIPSTIASAVAPRTITQFSKASTEDIKKVYDRDLGTYIKNKFKYDYFSGDDLPSKINLWGDHIDNAPKGNDPYSWYVLNFYKDRNPNENSLSYRIQMLHQETDDDKVIPSSPTDKMTIGKQKIQLTPQEHEQLQVYVGKRRAELTEAYMKYGSYNEDNNDVRIEKLSDIYREGSTEGKKMLISSTNRLTEIKNEFGASPIAGGRVKKPSRQKRPKRNAR